MFRTLLEVDGLAAVRKQSRPLRDSIGHHHSPRRLLFRCTPRHHFLGFEPTGAPISFSERVFYKFGETAIVEVWSIIDTQAIATQSARYVDAKHAFGYPNCPGW